MICFDAVKWQDIPADAQMVAGYINGSQSQWPANAWDRFPNAIKLRITVDPGVNDGDVYDCEPGNGSPENAGPWALKRIQSGLPHPCIYTMGSWLARVHASLAANGVENATVIWDARPDGNPAVSPGSVGTQWGWASNNTVPPQYRGTDIDISTFNDISWIQGVDMPLSFDDPVIKEMFRVIYELELEIVKANDQAKDDNGNPINARWTGGYALSHARHVDNSLAQLDLNADQRRDDIKAWVANLFKNSVPGVADAVSDDVINRIALAVVALLEKKLA